MVKIIDMNLEIWRYVIDKKASKDKKDGAGTLAATQKAKIFKWRYGFLNKPLKI